MAQQGTLYMVSAPSGAGKTSLLKALLQQLSGIKISVSHTTRGQREGEQEGVDYHFVEMATFQRLITEQAFLEYAEVFGNYYGTSRSWIEEQLLSGTDIILEIDWQGARQIRQLMPESRSIFILPPSKADLEVRLNCRAQDSAEVIAGRMAAAKQEMSHFTEYNYLIINDDFDQAVAELKAIFTAERQKCLKQQSRHQQLLNNLLA